MCTFDNCSFPSVCEVCDTKNPTYDDALRAVNEEKRAHEVDRSADAKGGVLMADEGQGAGASCSAERGDWGAEAIEEGGDCPT